ncbi:hypothetical protein [Nonomuraea dietziae]|uniref:hypothetical protein n=1 Tax=Nonomuraea dietziae TaxID=65515 RepID=UPI00340DC49C
MTAVAGDKKSFSDLLGDDDDDVQVPSGRGADRAPEALEADGATKETPQAGSGRQQASEGRPDDTWMYDEEPQRDSADQKRAKTGRSGGAVRGKNRRPGSGPAAVQLSKGQRDDWRWRLRSLAGKLHADEQALYQTTDRWEELVTSARKEGVPDSMLLVALMDAGIEEPERYL